MFQHLHHRLAHYLLLGLVWAALALPNLGAASLWDIDEGNNAEAAREMCAADNWAIPTFNFVLRVDKPALLYWLQIAAYNRFGVNEFAARLPSALAALLAVLATYELGRRMVTPIAGLLAGLILASAPAFGVAAHFANPDALLTAFTTLALLCFWWSYEHCGRGWFVTAGICTGLAVLAKGPVGFVLPASVVLLFLLWSRQLRRLWDRRLVWGTLVHGLVVAPWFAWVGIETKGEFLKGFLLTHNLGRFRAPMEGHHGSVFYYFVVLLVGFLPWSAFLGPAFVAAWKKSSSEQKDTTGSNRFLFCWIAVYFVFFTLSGTKLPNYILPLYPPVAILLARFLDSWRCGLIRPPTWVIHTTLACFGLAGLALGVGLLMAGGQLGGDTLLRGRHLPGIEIWAWTGLIPIVGALLAAAWTWRQRLNLAVSTLAMAAVLFLGTLAAGIGPTLNAYKAPAALAEFIEPHPAEPDILLGCYDYFQPSLVFYCGREVSRLQSENEVGAYLRWPLPVYLFMPATTWEQLESQMTMPHRLVGRRHDLYRNCDVVVVTNR
jgi:4-amino-4-deoxy-L-arabinose transferase-like glycosyltransferase